MSIEGGCIWWDGCCSASGAAWRNTCMLKRESASAITFLLPGMCLAVAEKSCLAAQRNTCRKSSIM